MPARATRPPSRARRIWTSRRWAHPPQTRSSGRRRGRNLPGRPLGRPAAFPGPAPTRLRTGRIAHALERQGGCGRSVARWDATGRLGDGHGHARQHRHARRRPLARDVQPRRHAGQRRRHPLRRARPAHSRRDASRLPCRGLQRQDRRPHAGRARNTGGGLLAAYEFRVVFPDAGPGAENAFQGSAVSVQFDWTAINNAADLDPPETTITSGPSPSGEPRRHLRLHGRRGGQHVRVLRGQRRVRSMHQPGDVHGPRRTAPTPSTCAPRTARRIPTLLRTAPPGRSTRPRRTSPWPTRARRSAARSP